MIRRVLCTAALIVVGVGCLAAADPGNALALLKGAEAQKNNAEIRKLAVDAIKAGLETAAKPAPAAAAEKAAWKEDVDFAKSVAEQGEYALYTLALASEPAEKVEVFGLLESASPKSKYLDMGYGAYLSALNESGDAAKIAAVAEKGLTNLPQNEDLLGVLADIAVSKSQFDRALTYANRLTAAMNSKKKPDEISATDWDKKKTLMLGHGYYIAGAMYGAKNQYPQADKNLRAALPFLGANEALKGQTLFQLGIVNYRYGMALQSKAKVLEAVKFSEEAAKIKGSWTEDAWRNAQLMKNDAAKMR
jgi:hypothetical protein